VPQQPGQYCNVPGGGTIINGQSVTAYSAPNPPAGQTCAAISQTRTCTNGQLSGSYTSPTCTTDCTLPWGGTIGTGQSVLAYLASSPSSPSQTCASMAQTRTCTSGVLSGSYTSQTCTPLACTLPWGGSIADGQSVTAYSTSNPGSANCPSVAQTRTCTNGSLSGSYTSQTCGPRAVVISSSVNTLNLWDYLVTNGQAATGTPGWWIVTIGSGVVIGSNSASLPGLDTGQIPAGSTLQLVNNGTIVGAGGAGGAGGGWVFSSPPITNCNTGRIAPVAGTVGGPALQVRLATAITNNGAIWGGGGGGGGGIANRGVIVTKLAGGGGGGGAGNVGGLGGLGGNVQGSPFDDGFPGGAGILTAGGTGGPGRGGTQFSAGTGGVGGGPGLAGAAGTSGSGQCTPPTAGAAGGAAGPAVLGNSFITWTTVGDVRGPLN
jgi:hypothetical protein